MKRKHLTFDDRLAIQAGLQQGLNISRIAKNIGKDRSTIGREIKAHRRLVTTSNGNNCIHWQTCTRIPACRKSCFKGKKQCHTVCNGCQDDCKEYQEEFCMDYEKPPFVCNPCDKRLRCRLRRMLYDAKYAQQQYEQLLSESRRGISLTEQELTRINGTISPLLKKGQSLPVICERYRDELPVTDRTIYSYIDAGLFEVRNIDLRRKLRRPERKKSGPVLRVDRKCHIGRTYEEYVEYMRQNPDAMVSQMDSVIIHKGGQTILTVLFTNCDLQLMFLRDRNTAGSVTEIFSHLRKILGDKHFSSLFQVVLTDRGSEFSDPEKIEVDMETGEIQCRVFYCDPMNSNQKSNCERNHEFIRYIITKKYPKDNYTEEEIRKMMNHINSYPRKKWNGQAPIDLFVKIYGQETATLLGLEKIPSDSIQLTPALLR
ncbi:MAG: IS30 family transposase [Oscillospiraceae bacterium]|nr:IS30 family transposase [Oscillospiraceae bacterium]